MSFVDRAKQGPPASLQGPPCAVSVLLDKLDPDERAGLEMLLKDTEQWTNAQVLKAIIDEGHKAPRSTVERHRRRDCRCFRDAQ